MGWIEAVENPLGIPAVAVLGDDVFSLAFVAYGVLMTAASARAGPAGIIRGDAVVRRPDPLVRGRDRGRRSPCSRWSS